MKYQELQEDPQKIISSADTTLAVTIYDPDRVPGDVKFAEIHGNAKRVALPVEPVPDLEGRINIDVCECCGLPTENDLLELCCDKVDLGFLGPGFPLYYEFIHFCVYALLGVFLIHGVYSIITNNKENDCIDGVPYNNLKSLLINISALSNITQNKSLIIPPECHRDYISVTSVANINASHDVYYTQSWLTLASVVVFLIAMQFLRRQQSLTENECDRGLVSASDYTIMLSDLQPGRYKKEDVERIIKNLWERGRHSSDNEQIKISKITLSYDISNYIQLVRKKNELLLKKTKAVESQKHNKPLPKDYDEGKLDEEIRNLNEKIEKEGDEIEESLENNSKVGDRVFITFSSQGQMRELMERIKLTFFENLVMKIKFRLKLITEEEEY
jgi:hypothetical protein